MITNITILSNGTFAPNQLIELGHKYDNALDSIQFSIPQEYESVEGHNYHYYLALSMKKLETILLPVNLNKDNVLEFIITTTITKNPGIYNMLFLITEGVIENGNIDDARKVFVSNTMQGQVLDNFLKDPVVDDLRDDNLQIIYESLLNLRDRVLKELNDGDYIGDVFVPTVDRDGNISWKLTDAQEAEFIEPEERNITGPTGPYYIPEVNEAGVLEWSGSANDLPAIAPTDVSGMVKKHADDYLDANLLDTVTPTINAKVEQVVTDFFTWKWDDEKQIFYIYTSKYDTTKSGE